MQKKLQDIQKLAPKRVQYVICDLSLKKDADKLMKYIDDNNKMIACFVSCAGILPTGALTDTSDEVIDQVLTLHITTATYLIKRVTAEMKKQKFGLFI